MIYNDTNLSNDAMLLSIIIIHREKADLHAISKSANERILSKRYFYFFSFVPHHNY